MRFKHPIHGFHDANTDTEREALLAAGWELVQSVDWIEAMPEKAKQAVKDYKREKLAVKRGA